MLRIVPLKDKTLLYKFSAKIKGLITLTTQPIVVCSISSDKDLLFIVEKKICNLLKLSKSIKLDTIQLTNKT